MTAAGMESRIRAQSLDVYLRESRYESPKEIFKLLGSLAAGEGLLKSGAKVADIGCAAGEFLYFLARRYPGPSYCGVDIFPELVEKAKRAVPGIEFRTGSVLDAGLLASAGFDVVFLSGVMSLCRDFHQVLDNALQWTRAGGRIYVFEAFNPYPVDVFLQFRRSGVAAGAGDGYWNILARKTVQDYLEQVVGSGGYRFIPFEMPFDLAPDPSDPVRTWTGTVEGKRLFTNGLSLLLNFEVVEICKPGGTTPPPPAQ